MATNSYMKRTARGNYGAYLNSDAYDISQAYGRYSTAKSRAWEYCRELCERLGGYALKVINHNTFTFTAGFESIDPETGVVRFTYITPNYDITIDAPAMA